MQIPLVMTVIGHDRPGLVEMVASIVAEHGGNWLESRMCRLGGEFAGILRIHAPADKEQALAQALTRLADQGLRVVVQVDPVATPAALQPMALLEIVGQDRPGIVREISRVLASQGVNVEELSTECTSAPMSGETLFKASAKLQIPPTCNSVALRRELEKIAADLFVDVTLQPLPIPARS